MISGDIPGIEPAVENFSVPHNAMCFLAWALNARECQGIASACIQAPAWFRISGLRTPNLKP